ncbi:MAG: tRNA glutamyl-Q(34) synthetase GluQRS [Burkholderiales bacterium]|nr:tRNA glutamyl-Q(34) synthetase GluQRS [Burkholderiales bacterium]
MRPCRGRFAPSPTGALHFGSLVAALGSCLDARSRGGEWLVRMDDLDPPRVAPGAADDILRTLEALGFAWDGAVLRQSERGDAYRAALARLRAAARVYACSCSRREIADSALPGAEGYVYPGTCRSRGLAEGAGRAVRVDTRGAAIAFDDAVQGRFAPDLERDHGDFVVLRADGIFAYQLAATVDDADQGITDVVRGADLLASTPRQLWLQRLLGLPAPRYAHLPVAVNPRGEKLSKQTGAAPVDRSRPAEALSGALAFLGHEPPGDALAAGTDGLWSWAIDTWRIERVPRRAAIVTIAPP